MAMIAIATARAADNDTSKIKYRPAQVTFVAPVGSNGLNAWQTANGFSLNVLFGMNGALRGAEFSGLAGMLRQDMKGAQFAGLFNSAGGDMKGFQAAGLANVVAGTVKGVQAAGLVSVAADSFTGAQFSGLANVAVGQGGGFQAAGLINVATGGRMTQVAGLANVTTRLNGTQIGFFNYADTLENGVPIGLFSVVRKGGYRSFELAFNETFYVNPGFKMGVNKFYNIFTAGVAYRDSMIVWGWGLGVGSMIPLGKKFDLSIEAVCYQVNLDEWFTHGPNLLNRLNVSFGWHVSPHATLTFTPSWNVTVVDTFDEYGEPVREPWAPYSVYDLDWGNGFISQMYPGFAVGIRF